MTKKKFRWSRYLKAIVAFIAPVLLSIQAAIQTNGVSLNEVYRTALAGLITSLVVWAVPNSQN